jgi:hypothetical protein
VLPVRDTDVAEHEASGSPREDPQVLINRLIRNPDSEFSLA